jgi:hypothetical protein
VLEDNAKDIPVHKIQSIFSDIDTDNILDNVAYNKYISGIDSSLCTCNGEENKKLLSKIQVKNTSLSNDVIEINNDKCSCVALPDGTNNFEFTYNISAYNLDNQIVNSSFENAMWTKDVEDCNNYDDNGILSMKQSNLSTDGKYSLELQATTHIACTSQGDINVDANSVYLFSFDYQSDNANHARYHISFDEGTTLSENLYIEDSQWHTFTKKIIIPKNATKMRIHVYSDSDDTNTSIITRYDNFKFIKIPNIVNKFYIIDNTKTTTHNPQNISFDIQNPTKHTVHITSAIEPFYLVMSEKYHDKWQLQFNNNKVQGLLQNWIPFVRPDIVSEANHFRYMTFLNGWYIDTQKYCKDTNLCKQNDDGSYDMEMVIEFFPQRWFYLGLFISGITFIMLFGYLCIRIYKRYKK